MRAGTDNRWRCFHCGGCLLALWLLTMHVACENRPELPPEEKQVDVSREFAVDVRHFATIVDDQSTSIPNLKLVLFQLDESGGIAGITLRSIPAGLDGSTLKFDEFKPTTREELLERPIYLVAAGVLDKGGNGILTPMRFYQPKFAELQFSEITESEARGTIRGEFYVFRLGRRSLLSQVKELDIDFSAAVVVK